jgi:iron-sulfur cluster repair protein YtfE (RIC family)
MGIVHDLHELHDHRDQRVLMTEDIELRTITVSAVVARYPASIPVFKRFGLDTCCGGGVSIESAAHRDGVAVEAVINALNGATACHPERGSA